MESTCVITALNCRGIGSGRSTVTSDDEFPTVSSVYVLDPIYVGLGLGEGKIGCVDRRRCTWFSIYTFQLIVGQFAYGTGKVIEHDATETGAYILYEDSIVAPTTNASDYRHGASY